MSNSKVRVKISTEHSRENNRIIRLKSKNDEVFKIGEKFVQKYETLRGMLQNSEIDKSVDLLEPIEIPHNSSVLRRVLKWLTTNHSRSAIVPDEKHRIVLSESDKEILAFKDDNGELFEEFILAVDFFNIPDLIHIVGQHVADLARNKTVDELRQLLNIKNDFTAEEKENIDQYYFWVDQ